MARPPRMARQTRMARCTPPGAFPVALLALYPPQAAQTSGAAQPGTSVCFSYSSVLGCFCLSSDAESRRCWGRRGFCARRVADITSVLEDVASQFVAVRAWGCVASASPSQGTGSLHTPHAHNHCAERGCVGSRRILISSTRKPVSYINLAKRFLQEHGEVQLSALGIAVRHAATLQAPC